MTALQRSRSSHFPRFLKMGLNLGHHPELGDKSESIEDLGDPSSVHFETFDDPFAGLDGPENT
jgi:hypothetical protein